MNFPLNAYLLAVISAFFTSLVVVPLWRNWCVRAGLVDDPGHRKIHTEPTPLAGGLTVMTGLLMPILLACFGLWLQGMLGIALVDPGSTHLLVHGFTRREIELA